MSSKNLFRVFLCLALLYLSTTLMKMTELMNHHEFQVVAKESIGNIAVEAMKSIDTAPLEHERMFIATLKDCMPEIKTDNKERGKKKECKTFVPEGSKERIAVLAPPGKLDSSLVKFIRAVLRKGRKGNEGEFAATQVEVIRTSNMAPYGYGKTHGYTRIIRIVPQPLLLGATDTLKAAVTSLSPSLSLSLNDITLEDFKAALRQQIRYHCRLNHIAAHTQMWTIGAEDFAQVGIGSLVETAREFFGLDLEQEDLLNDVNAEFKSLGPDDNDVSKHGVLNENHNPLTELNHIHAEGNVLINLLQMKRNSQKKGRKTKNTTSDVLKILDDVLLDEMRLSNNLSDWPCESFWTVGEPENRLKISPIIRSISKAMSPNCTAPYASCFVKKDKCEARGDGKCK